MHTTIDSPVGPLTLVSADGRLSGVYMHEQRHRPAPETFGEPDATPFTAVIAPTRPRVGLVLVGISSRTPQPLALPDSV